MRMHPARPSAVRICPVRRGPPRFSAVRVALSALGRGGILSARRLEWLSFDPLTAECGDRGAMMTGPKVPTGIRVTLVPIGSRDYSPMMGRKRLESYE